MLKFCLKDQLLVTNFGTLSCDKMVLILFGH